MTFAAVDRLVHHCHIVEISGESHRRNQAVSRLQGRSRRPVELSSGDRPVPMAEEA